MVLNSKYTISVVANTIVLNVVRVGNQWTSDDGNWDGTDTTGLDWSGGTTAHPNATKEAFFQGQGTSAVVVIGDQVSSEVLVDTSTGVLAYTFSGDKVTAGSLTVAAGSLTIDNDVSSEIFTIDTALFFACNRFTFSVGVNVLFSMVNWLGVMYILLITSKPTS